MTMKFKERVSNSDGFRVRIKTQDGGMIAGWPLCEIEVSNEFGWSMKLKGRKDRSPERAIRLMKTLIELAEGERA